MFLAHDITLRHQQPSYATHITQECTAHNLSKASALISERIRYSIFLLPVDAKQTTLRHQCLYGENQAVPMTIQLLNMLQLLLSAACAFLFALALRNRFKIK